MSGLVNPIFLRLKKVFYWNVIYNINNLDFKFFNFSDISIYKLLTWMVDSLGLATLGYFPLSLRIIRSYNSTGIYILVKRLRESDLDVSYHGNRRREHNNKRKAGFKKIFRRGRRRRRRRRKGAVRVTFPKNFLLRELSADIQPPFSQKEWEKGIRDFLINPEREFHSSYHNRGYRYTWVSLLGTAERMESVGWVRSIDESVLGPDKYWATIKKVQKLYKTKRIVPKYQVISGDNKGNKIIKHDDQLFKIKVASVPMYPSNKVSYEFEVPNNSKFVVKEKEYDYTPDGDASLMHRKISLHKQRIINRYNNYVLYIIECALRDPRKFSKALLREMLYRWTKECKLGLVNLPVFYTFILSPDPKEREILDEVLKRREEMIALDKLAMIDEAKRVASEWEKEVISSDRDEALKKCLLIVGPRAEGKSMDIEKNIQIVFGLYEKKVEKLIKEMKETRRKEKEKKKRKEKARREAERFSAEYGENCRELWKMISEKAKETKARRKKMILGEDWGNESVPIKKKEEKTRAPLLLNPFYRKKIIYFLRPRGKKRMKKRRAFRLFRKVLENNKILFYKSWGLRLKFFFNQTGGFYPILDYKRKGNLFNVFYNNHLSLIKKKNINLRTNIWRKKKKNFLKNYLLKQMGRARVHSRFARYLIKVNKRKKIIPTAFNRFMVHKYNIWQKKKISNRRRQIKLSWKKKNVKLKFFVGGVKKRKYLTGKVSRSIKKILPVIKKTLKINKSRNAKIKIENKRKFIVIKKIKLGGKKKSIRKNDKIKIVLKKTSEGWGVKKLKTKKLLPKNEFKTPYVVALTKNFLTRKKFFERENGNRANYIKSINYAKLKIKKTKKMSKYPAWLVRKRERKLKKRRWKNNYEDIYENLLVIRFKRQFPLKNILNMQRWRLISLSAARNLKKAALGVFRYNFKYSTLKTKLRTSNVLYKASILKLKSQKKTNKFSYKKVMADLRTLKKEIHSAGSFKRPLIKKIFLEKRSKSRKQRIKERMERIMQLEKELKALNEIKDLRQYIKARFAYNRKREALKNLENEKRRVAFFRKVKLLKRKIKRMFPTYPDKHYTKKGVKSNYKLNYDTKDEKLKEDKYAPIQPHVLDRVRNKFYFKRLKRIQIEEDKRLKETEKLKKLGEKTDPFLKFRKKGYSSFNNFLKLKFAKIGLFGATLDLKNIAIKSVDKNIHITPWRLLYLLKHNKKEIGRKFYRFFKKKFLQHLKELPKVYKGLMSKKIEAVIESAGINVVGSNNKTEFLRRFPLFKYYKELGEVDDKFSSLVQGSSIPASILSASSVRRLISSDLLAGKLKFDTNVADDSNIRNTRFAQHLFRFIKKGNRKHAAYYIHKGFYLGTNRDKGWFWLTGWKTYLNTTKKLSKKFKRRWESIFYKKTILLGRHLKSTHSRLIKRIFLRYYFVRRYLRRKKWKIMKKDFLKRRALISVNDYISSFSNFYNKNSWEYAEHEYEQHETGQEGENSFIKGLDNLSIRLNKDIMKMREIKSNVDRVLRDLVDMIFPFDLTSSKNIDSAGWWWSDQPPVTNPPPSLHLLGKDSIDYMADEPHNITESMTKEEYMKIMHEGDLKYFSRPRRLVISQWCKSRKQTAASKAWVNPDKSIYMYSTRREFLKANYQRKFAFDSSFKKKQVDFFKQVNSGRSVKTSLSRCYIFRNKNKNKNLPPINLNLDRNHRFIQLIDRAIFEVKKGIFYRKRLKTVRAALKNLKQLCEQINPVSEDIWVTDQTYFSFGAGFSLLFDLACNYRPRSRRALSKNCRIISQAFRSMKKLDTYDRKSKNHRLEDFIYIWAKNRYSIKERYDYAIMKSGAKNSVKHFMKTFFSKPSLYVELDTRPTWYNNIAPKIFTYTYKVDFQYKFFKSKGKIARSGSNNLKLKSKKSSRKIFYKRKIVYTKHLLENYYFKEIFNRLVYRPLKKKGRLKYFFSKIEEADKNIIGVINQNHLSYKSKVTKLSLFSNMAYFLWKFNSNVWKRNIEDTTKSIFNLDYKSNFKLHILKFRLIRKIMFDLFSEESIWLLTIKSFFYKLLYRYLKGFIHHPSIYLINIATKNINLITAQFLLDAILIKLHEKFKVNIIFKMLFKVIGSFRKNAIKGVRIIIAGRFNRRDRMVYKIKKRGHIALNTKFSIVDYAIGVVPLKFSVCVCKIWIAYGKREKF